MLQLIGVAFPNAGQLKMEFKGPAAQACAWAKGIL